MELNDCIKQGIVKKTEKDIDLIKSLLKNANSNEYGVTNANLDERNITAYISMAYDSLRITLEVVAISFEYKILHHKCLGILLKIMIPKFNILEFDKLRKIRNGINYYWDSISLKDGKQIIRKILKLRQIIIELIDLEIKKN